MQRMDTTTCQQILYKTGEPCGKPVTREGFDSFGESLGRCGFHAKAGYGFEAIKPTDEMIQTAKEMRTWLESIR